jgi:hypothetical protein
MEDYLAVKLAATLIYFQQQFTYITILYFMLIFQKPALPDGQFYFPLVHIFTSKELR